MRAAPVPLLVVALAIAGCGGSGGPDPEPAPGPPGERRPGVDLRSVDTRTPFVAATGGVWRCPTEGRLALAVSEEGEASLTIDGACSPRSRRRARSSTACARWRRRTARRRRPRGSGSPPHGRLGAATVRCGAPATVLVALRGGDITVRAPGGRFLAGAAVRADRIGVASYWGARCTTL